ncbi:MULTISPECIES: hypothetical protein [Enterocloster]|uniref:hypothetical protein n=1 Tax=Enterocloster TaxID=2719313 RepID=UPI00159456D7|nr:hypothetical protein [Enterocloster alcoholdehydrogenati]
MEQFRPRQFLFLVWEHIRAVHPLLVRAAAVADQEAIHRAAATQVFLPAHWSQTKKQKGTPIR